MVGGGVRISDSVSRKIIIARNIVQRPALLILDDFLLGVERSEKKRILDLITSDQFGWTVILISNDPMILQSAQRVIVLNEGSVNDSGTFDEVFNRNAILKGLIQSYSINPEA
jgi:ABC-type branched-subunit amino acid transport system ATPase component